MKRCVWSFLSVSNECAVDSIQASAAVHSKNSKVQAINSRLTRALVFAIQVMIVRSTVAVSNARLYDCHLECMSGSMFRGSVVKTLSVLMNNDIP